jgi:hypothetical protein
MVEPFSFEHSHRFTEREFAEVVALMCWRPAQRRTAGVLFAVLAVVCLLWSYTLLIGILLLLMEGLTLWAKHSIPGTAANTYRESKLLQKRIAYGVSDTGLSIRAPALSAEASWRYLRNWRIRDGWLILPCEGIPTVYLPVSGLREAGVYEQVLALARAHGTEFDRPR